MTVTSKHMQRALTTFEPTALERGSPFTPKSPEAHMDKRENTVKVRFTESELLAAKLNCPRSEFARWLRELSLDPLGNSVPKRRPPVPKCDPILLRHIAAIGSNINQIARMANAKTAPLDRILILSELEKITAHLEVLRDR